MTPTTTAFEFRDVVLVPFPFSDQRGGKRRPAAVISSATYHGARRDLIILAITSQPAVTQSFGEKVVQDWRSAGLLKPSLLKPVLTTIERSLVLRTLGRLTPTDQAALRALLDEILGRPLAATA